MSLLRKVFGFGARDDQDAFDAALAPEAPFFAIGDIHGCYRLLQDLLAKIDAKDTEATIVCVGDYVDRGEQSGKVLRLLHRISNERPGRFFCLKGNHEEMLLDFVADPERNADRWLRFGGLQTIASLAITLDKSDPVGLRDQLVAAIGQDLLAWLSALPMSWQSGNVFVSHAGADPRMPIHQQPEDALIWGHPMLGRTKRQDQIWVVRGHVVVDSANSRGGVISLDTAAYATGQLTAAEINNGSVIFHKA